MSKSEIFIALLNSCIGKDGRVMVSRCAKNPEIFFKRKNLLDLYNSLEILEKEIFLNEQKFFDILVEYNIKNESNIHEAYQLHNKCLICGSETKFRSAAEGYNNTCCKECATKLREISNTEKYGYSHPSKIPEIKIKKEQTCMKNFNVKNPSQSKMIKDKKIQKSLDKFGTNYPTQSLSVKNKIRKTCETIGCWTPEENRDDFEHYKILVIRETEKQAKKYQEYILNFDLRSKDYHLDHVYSIAEGFRNNILPSYIAHYTNLRVITYHDNTSKKDRCDKTINQLFEDFEIASAW